ncbi:CCR4-NOT transcription complex subunit 7 [Dacryopinax primogenitus]|uniref:poly(A)-specific ribonuclease n=1 Tax=Dacryopinax primogenitus (strain DJM 731) TaxID=1858805 RepID=M5FSF4_DACPD|nr:CCR4-NOT transcription complex subunit 7 [Dacryopinax primogenitus]EJT98783.1 CCR4-NOT transcription complex subunit 7 [Dacryopinax primogenitus]
MAVQQNQQVQQQLGVGASGVNAQARENQVIREVWASNFEAEMAYIRELVVGYPYVGMDTEFPGVVARPIGSFKTSSDYHYQTMRCNVDLLKLIQLGITLTDEHGRHPPEYWSWQFNFRFDLNEDMYAPESIDLLSSSGLDFVRHQAEGIEPDEFAELFITSGLVANDEVCWVSFHSGYDFGYLISALTSAPLPKYEDDFFHLLSILFPSFYDIKFIWRHVKAAKGGLQDIADELGIPRIGPQHQAGSDSLLTSSVFFKICELYFPEQMNESYRGHLYGLGPQSTPMESTPPSQPAPNPYAIGMGMGQGAYNNVPGMQYGYR